MFRAAPAPGRYGWPMIILHWLMFLLVAAAYGLMEWREFIPKGAPMKTTLMHWHWIAGLLVFAFWFLRIGVRAVAAPPPAITPSPPAWQEMASRLVHRALYALMLLLPVSGYLMVNAKGRVVEVAGFALPVLLAADPSLAETLEEVHETLANIGYVLIGLHAAASLWHHYVQKDDTLTRMLPSSRS